MVLSFTEKNQRQASGVSNKLTIFVSGLFHKAHLDVSYFKREGWMAVQERAWKTALDHFFETLHNLYAPYLLSETGGVADARSSQYNLVVPQR